MVLSSTSDQQRELRTHQHSAAVRRARVHREHPLPHSAAAHVAASDSTAPGGGQRRPDVADPEVARIVVADRQPLVLAGIRHFVASRPWLEVVGLADSGRSAIERVREIQPEIALVDHGLADLPVADLVRELHAAAPAVRVVLHTAGNSPAALAAAAQPGVAAVVHKEAGLPELDEKLRRVARDERHPAAEARPDGPAAQRFNGLTAREHEILRLVATGQTNSEIARELGLALNTVKTYFQRTLEKLGVHNRVEALLRAIELGLL